MPKADDRDPVQENPIALMGEDAVMEGVFGSPASEPVGVAGEGMGSDSRLHCSAPNYEEERDEEEDSPGQLAGGVQVIRLWHRGQPRGNVQTMYYFLKN